MLLHWPNLPITFRLILFSIFILSLYGLVLWGCGHRTDWVSSTLSRVALLPFFYNTNNNNMAHINEPKQSNKYFTWDAIWMQFLLMAKN